MYTVQSKIPKYKLWNKAGITVVIKNLYANAPCCNVRCVTFMILADTSGPFKFAGAGQKLFGVGSTSKETADDGDDGSTVAPSEDIHFEPVIPLPDLVEVKTGRDKHYN